jgi:hypothetical protein
MFLLLNHVFAQEKNQENCDGIFKIIKSIELERESEMVRIKSYDDLVCTYWTREIDSSSINLLLGSGYIFLPNNLILIVQTFFEPIKTTGNENIPIGIYNIYAIDKLCTYKIIDGRIVLNLGMPIIYLDEGYLYILHNNETEKYRLEGKFENLESFKFEFSNEPISK